MHFEQGGSGSGCLFMCLEFQYALRERVLGRVGEGCGMVVVDVLDAEEAEYFEDLLAEVTEGDGAVVREALLDEDVTVEAAHLRDRENADAAEGLGSDRKDFAFCDVGAKDAFAVALQAVEGDLTGSDVALEGAAGEVRIGAGGLEQAVLDQLILDRAVGAQLAFRRIAAGSP